MLSERPVALGGGDFSWKERLDRVQIVGQGILGGEEAMRVRELAILAVAMSSAGAPARADVVTEWIDTYRAVTRFNGGAPCPISRSGPMMCLAMYDAVNSIDRADNFGASFKPYQRTLGPAQPGSSREAAAAAAAYAIMAGTNPIQSDDLPQVGALIQQTYDTQLAAIADGPAKANGIAFGEAVGAQMLLLRHLDGYDANPSYVLGGMAGD